MSNCPVSRYHLMSVNTNQESVSHESIIRVFVLTLTIPCVPCGLLMINDSQESLFRMIDSVFGPAWLNMTKESYNLTIIIKILAKIRIYHATWLLPINLSTQCQCNISIIYILLFQYLLLILKSLMFKYSQILQLDTFFF